MSKKLNANYGDLSRLTNPPSMRTDMDSHFTAANRSQEQTDKLIQDTPEENGTGPKKSKEKNSLTRAISCQQLKVKTSPLCHLAKIIEILETSESVLGASTTERTWIELHCRVKAELNPKVEALSRVPLSVSYFNTREGLHLSIFQYLSDRVLWKICFGDFLIY